MPSPKRTTALVAALSVALTAGAAPSELRLLPVGRFKATDGSGRPEGIPQGWLLDQASAAALVAAAETRQSDYAIDFEHQTLHAAANGQPAPAAGWFKRLEWREGDGLYALDVRWTARAAAMIAAGEYRYLSPLFRYAPDGRVLALGPAALTNNPGLDGLTDLAALAALFPAAENPHTTKENPNMKALLLALGLPETATEAEALAALAALKTNHTAALTAAAVVDPAKFAPIATLTAVQGELSTARTELAALKAAQHEGEVDRVVTEAQAAGKLTPAMLDWAKDLGKRDLAALNAYVAAAPVVTKPGETQTGGKPAGGGGGTAVLAAVEQKVCAQMRIAPEDFAKARDAQAA